MIILLKLSKEDHIVSKSPDETISYGEKLSCDLLAGSHIFALYGTLGAGKTLLTKGIARGLQVPDWYYVNSPTFTLINEYEGRLPLYHFDLYRLDNQEDLLAIGFEDYLQKPGLMVIEWPEKVGDMIFSLSFTKITLAIAGEKQRQITISYNSTF